MLERLQQHVDIVGASAFEPGGDAVVEVPGLVDSEDVGNRVANQVVSNGECRERSLRESLAFESGCGPLDAGGWPFLDAGEIVDGHWSCSDHEHREDRCTVGRDRTQPICNDTTEVGFGIVARCQQLEPERQPGCGFPQCASPRLVELRCHLPSQTNTGLAVEASSMVRTREAPRTDRSEPSNVVATGERREAITNATGWRLMCAARSR